MKIAITADTHLKTDTEYPERLNALKNILDQLTGTGVKDLIIAGDLFDAESHNYSLFDELCKKEAYRNLKFHVIPGNHDPTINSKYFTAPNINIYSSPYFLDFEDSGFTFFFIPYIPGKMMGEIIAKHKQDIPERWVLISHGDYVSGIKEPNTYEKGVYMPLGRTDIEYYNPAKAVLGHIHKRMEIGRVSYPGSPCGMDINETGKRSFYILDMGDLSITEREIDTDIIFFNEKISVFPTSNEFKDLENRVEKVIKGWGLGKKEIPKARIRLRVKGYTSDKNRLDELLKSLLSGFSFYNDEPPDISGVSLFDDPEREGIVDRVKRKIDLLQQGNGYTESKKDLIIEQALSIILKE